MPSEKSEQTGVGIGRSPYAMFFISDIARRNSGYGQGARKRRKLNERTIIHLEGHFAICGRPWGLATCKESY